MYCFNIKEEVEPTYIKKIMDNLSSQPDFKKCKKALQGSKLDKIKRYLLTLELIASSADRPKTPKKINKI